jgi:fimbrial chaperone protein
VPRAALCALALLAPALATAADWNIDPVRVELSPDQQTAAIIVRNESDEPSSVQIQAVLWSQVNGKDVYTPTRELLVSPPIATIPPKSDQVIRVALRRPADATKELAYRINLQELPPQQAPGVTGVQVAMRIGLPVFVQSQKGDAKPRMTWNVSRLPDNKLKLTLQNQGNAHVQVSDFSLYAPGSERPIGGETRSSYVLAGQTQEWVLQSSAAQKSANSRLRLKAFTDANHVDTELALGSP